MDTINEVLVYWPFLMFVVVISVVAQILKTRVITASFAKKSKIVFWIRRLFPLVLVFIGAITGLLWQGTPNDGVDTLGKKALYFMGASCVSITMFNTFKNWIKKKIELDIGDSEDK